MIKQISENFSNNVDLAYIYFNQPAIQIRTNEDTQFSWMFKYVFFLLLDLMILKFTEVKSDEDVETITVINSKKEITKVPEKLKF